MQHLPPLGIAPLNGAVSWETYDTWIWESEKLIFKLQRVRETSILTKMTHNPWRVIVSPKGQWCARVIFHSPKYEETNKFWFQIKDICLNEKFEEPITDISNLKNGDVVSHDCSMGRHYAIYIKENENDSYFVEYQGESNMKEGIIQIFGIFTGIGSGKQGKVVKTSLNDFFWRLIETNKLNSLKKVNFFFDQENLNNQNECVKRAKSEIGEKGYHFLYNNCETFVRWTKTGDARSIQSVGYLEKIIDLCTKGLTVFASIGLFTWVLWNFSSEIFLFKDCFNDKLPQIFELMKKISICCKMNSLLLFLSDSFFSLCYQNTQQKKKYEKKYYKN